MPKLKINLGPKKPVEHAFFAVSKNIENYKQFLKIFSSRTWTEMRGRGTRGEARTNIRRRKRRRNIIVQRAKTLIQRVISSTWISSTI